MVSSCTSISRIPKLQELRLTKDDLQKVPASRAAEGPSSSTSLQRPQGQLIEESSRDQRSLHSTPPQPEATRDKRALEASNFCRSKSPKHTLPLQASSVDSPRSAVHRVHPIRCADCDQTYNVFAFEIVTLCFYCNHWICFQYIGLHEPKCRSSVTVCEKACLECGLHQCGRTDCVIAEALETEGGDTHHICALCIVKSVDFRHPHTWPEVSAKDHPQNPVPRGYGRAKLTAARAFQLLDSRNQQYLSRSPGNQWNAFVGAYNYSRAEGENSTTLASIYASTLGWRWFF